MAILGTITKKVFTSSAYLIIIFIISTFTLRYKCQRYKETSSISAVVESEYNHDNNNNDPLFTPLPLYFIMHIGPLKTATSTIQCELKKLYKTDFLPATVDLAETNTCQVQIVEENKIYECLRRWVPDIIGMPDCWKKDYIPYIERQKKYNRSIIVSNEILAEISKRIKEDDSKQFMTDLQSSLMEYGYQLWIITTYRYYPEWIYSLYTQKNKIMKNPSKAHRNYNDWPDEGGMIVPTIESWIDDHQPQRFYTDKLIDFYSQTNDINNNITIKVMNMDDDDIMKQFLCDALPISLSKIDSTTTTNNNMCDLVQYIKDGSKNKSPDYLWCNTLATKAHDNGLLPLQNNSISRYQIIKDIEKYAKKDLNLDYKSSTNDSIPKICPTLHFYNDLLDESMTHYINIFSISNNVIQKDYDFYKILDDKKREYEERLNRMIDEHEFCTIDAEEMLLRKEWIIFFKRYSS